MAECLLLGRHCADAPFLLNIVPQTWLRDDHSLCYWLLPFGPTTQDKEKNLQRSLSVHLHLTGLWYRVAYDQQRRGRWGRWWRWAQCKKVRQEHDIHLLAVEGKCNYWLVSNRFVFYRLSSSLSFGRILLTLWRSLSRSRRCQIHLRRRWERSSSTTRRGTSMIFSWSSDYCMRFFKDGKCIAQSNLPRDCQLSNKWKLSIICTGLGSLGISKSASLKSCFAK